MSQLSANEHRFLFIWAVHTYQQGPDTGVFLSVPSSQVSASPLDAEGILTLSFWREPELLSCPRSHMWRVSLKHFLQKTFAGFRTCSVYYIIERRRRRRWHPTPVLLSGKSHGWRSLVGCSPWAREESDTTSLFTFMHWRRKWQPTPVFLPGESQGWGSLVGCRLWGRTELDTTEAT